MTRPGYISWVRQAGNKLSRAETDVIERPFFFAATGMRLVHALDFERAPGVML